MSLGEAAPKNNTKYPKTMHFTICWLRHDTNQGHDPAGSMLK